jgi:uncharacterized protein YjiS (DUF1127 family)
MKTTVYFPTLASLAGLARHFAPTRNSTAVLSDLDMTGHLLRDIGLRRGPVGPDGRNYLPF